MKVIIASVVSCLLTLVAVVAGTAWAQGVSVTTVLPKLSLSSRGAKLCPGLATDVCMTSNAAAIAVSGEISVNQVTILSGNGISANSQIQLGPASGNVLKIATSGAEPTCDSTKRNGIFIVQGGAGVKDTVRICQKDAGDAYAWRTIY